MKRRKQLKKLSLSLLLVVALSLTVASVAFAHEGPHTYTTTLDSLNGSGASGTATVTVEGNQATVDVQSQGLAPGAPHAQHIHIGGQNVCPTAAADTDGSGFISVAEGQPSYGPIEVSLTTTGDVSTESGAAVDRMPKANADGTLSYSRTFTLPADVSPEAVANGVIVQHGIDINGSGMYDFGAGPSSINPDLPFEGTVPADCGKLVETAAVMPATGGPSPMILGLTGGAALVFISIAGLYVARRTRRA